MVVASFSKLDGRMNGVVICLTDDARQSSGAANGSVHGHNTCFSKELILAGKVFLYLLQPIAKILETLYLILP